jgi:hypothetical protein
MTTAEIISGVLAGKKTDPAPAKKTTKKKVGKGKKTVTMTVTHIEPTTVKVVDETVKAEPTATNQRPVDPGKVKVEILPGLSLISYSRGYYVLEQKGRNYAGQKTCLRRILYKDCIDAVIRELVVAFDKALTYEQAHAGTHGQPEVG